MKITLYAILNSLLIHWVLYWFSNSSPFKLCCVYLTCTVSSYCYYHCYYSEAATFVGRLSNCEEYQLEAFIQHVKHCFQSVVQDWTVSEFLTIGILFGNDSCLLTVHSIIKSPFLSNFALLLLKGFSNRTSQKLNLIHG